MHRLLAVVVPVLAFAGQDAAAQACTVPQWVRDELPDSPPPIDRFAFGSAAGDPESPREIGVGHLFRSPEDPGAEGPPGSDPWLFRLELPLSAGPGEAPSGGIARGWVVRSGRPTVPLDVSSLIETGYEEPSILVMESRPDGWLRIRLSPQEVGNDWTLPCGPSAAPVRLTYASWADWFIEWGGPLFFRSTPGTPRSGPSARADPLPPLGESYSLEPIEVEGDWMRVGIREPSDYCRPGVVAETREAWIRWYRADVGPLVWYFTRGC